jgi:hypothetical protein
MTPSRLDVIVIGGCGIDSGGETTGRFAVTDNLSKKCGADGPASQSRPFAGKGFWAEPRISLDTHAIRPAIDFDSTALKSNRELIHTLAGSDFAGNIHAALL